jgi:hypothetical protein
VTEKDRQRRKDRNNRYEFTALPDFDKAMQKIAQTPKTVVEHREKAEKRRKA